MRRLFVALLSCGLSACALIQEDGRTAAQIPPEEIRLAQDIHLARDGWPQASWWTGYGDAQLDALMDYALRHAPDIAVARNRIEQAQAGVRLVAADTRPQGALMAEADRQRVSGEGFLQLFSLNNPALGVNGPWYTEGTIGLGASYRVDLWGEDRARVDSAIGAKNARLAEAAEVELELSAAVAQLYFEIQSLRRKTELLQQARSIQAEVVASHKAHLDRGLEARTPEADAAALLSQMEQQISLMQTKDRELREILRALIGAHADDMPRVESAPLPAAHAGVPETLSYELLARRPDLQTMRWYVQASFSQVEAAKAAFYPSFDIKAFFGRNAIHSADLWSPNAKQYNLIPGLSLPIFDGGKLNANLGRVRTESNMLIEEYNKAVLNAVRDVAVSGTRLQGAERDVQLQEARVREMQVASASAQAHYERGLYSLVKVREAQLPVIYQEVELSDLRARQLFASISLVKALGGGYSSDGSSSSTKEH